MLIQVMVWCIHLKDEAINANRGVSKADGIELNRIHEHQTDVCAAFQWKRHHLVSGRVGQRLKEVRIGHYANLAIRQSLSEALYSSST